MLRITTTFLTFCLLTVRISFGQTNNCSETLMKAQDTYKEGRISEISDILQPCLQTGFTKAERIEAFRLLTLTYLYFNEKEKAEGAMTDLLKNDPEYKIRQNDPTEFVNLYNSFRTSPILLIGAKFGINHLDVDVHKNFSLDNSSIRRGDYNSKVGIQGGLIVHFPIRKKLTLVTELLYSLNSFTYSDKLFEYASLEYSEKQIHLGIPVFLNLNFGKNPKWVPYLNLGGEIGYLWRAKALPVRVDATDGQNKREIKEGEIVISDLRKKLNLSIIAGGGLKVKDVLGRGYLFVDVRYTYGINNVVKPEKRYTNEDLVYKYLYVDNDFSINSFQYSLGYIYPLYKPKLKKVKNEKREE